MIQSKIKNSNITLTGRKVITGYFAPDAKIIDQEFQDKKIYDFQDKIIVIFSIPSVDMDMAIDELKELSSSKYNFNDTVILCISNDLVYTQQKFAVNNNINNILFFSDYKYYSFGINYGLLIRELNLLTKSLLIIGKNRVLRYKNITDNLDKKINFDDFLYNLEAVTLNPMTYPEENLPLNCRNEPERALPLSEETVKDLLLRESDWTLKDRKTITKKLEFNSPYDAKHFADIVTNLSNEQDHHPSLILNYNTVLLELTTHKVNGLTENDFIMARIIDELG